MIRLIGRSTVEEIILKRAEAKLKLTEAVIEGGQFSSESANSNKEDLIADKDVKVCLTVLAVAIPLLWNGLLTLYLDCTSTCVKRKEYYVRSE